jgi:hypothetical protein
VNLAFEGILAFLDALPAADAFALTEVVESELSSLPSGYRQQAMTVADFAALLDAPSSQVKIIRGTWEGRDAVVVEVRDDQMVVEVQVFGRGTPVEVSLGDVAVESAATTGVAAVGIISAAYQARGSQAFLQMERNHCRSPYQITIGATYFARMRAFRRRDFGPAEACLPHGRNV